MNIQSVQDMRNHQNIGSLPRCIETLSLSIVMSLAMHSFSSVRADGPPLGYNPVSKVIGDDNMTSTLYGPATDRTSNCIWVDTGLTKSGFTAANGWKFTYASAADDNKVLADLKIDSYKAWVVTQPTFTDPGGTTYGGNIVNDEAGGAEFKLSFTPTVGDPLMGKTVHWIQGVNSAYRGGAYDIHLDAPASPTTPFYDQFSAAGQSYFYDNPGANEAEYEGNPIADAQFQVYLAVDNGKNGLINHDVTIYAGKWWGYRLTASEVPEPSEYGAMACFGLLAFAAYRKAKNQ